MEELIAALTTQLGVSDTHARGGAGILFRAARERLGTEQFGQLLGSVPGVSDLLASAPDVSSSGPSLLGGLASMVTKMGASSDMAQTANLLAAFSKVGLSKDAIMQFAPIVLGYVEKHGGPELVTKLRSALKV